MKQLKERSKKFSVDVFWFAQDLPKMKGMDAFASQVIRSSFSQAANYRAVCRAKSTKDFIYKMKVVLEEADESLFWLEALQDLNVHENPVKLNQLIKEANELTSIYAASLITVQRNAGITPD